LTYGNAFDQQADAKQLDKFVREGAGGTRLADGGNLYAVKHKRGSVSWAFIATREGRTVEIGLGPVRDVTLGGARAKAAEHSSKLATGSGSMPSSVLTLA
jgi:hypothetical protein